MKKLLAVLIVVALAVVAVSVADAAYIASTKHNMASSYTTNAVRGNIDEICIYCHTPHNGSQAAGQPLWNRNASTTSYTAYTSATMSGTANGATNAASALCFSCHDGITSINSLINYQGSSFTGTNKVVSSGFAIGTSSGLSNDHPVGMPIPTTKAGYKTAVALNAYLVSNNVECSTCHAVHGAGFSSLLRISNSQSAMCLDCHDK